VLKISVTYSSWVVHEKSCMQSKRLETWQSLTCRHIDFDLLAEFSEVTKISPLREWTNGPQCRKEVLYTSHLFTQMWTFGRHFLMQFTIFSASFELLTGQWSCFSWQMIHDECYNALLPRIVQLHVTCRQTHNPHASHSNEASWSLLLIHNV
jgi:hypothetical protein